MAHEVMRNRMLPALFLAVLVSAGARAAVPATINYQGRVLGMGGSPAPGPVDIEIGIWDSLSGGKRLYREQHPDTPLANGVFDLRIGAGSDAEGVLDAATFSAADRWLELAIDGETLGPRQSFSSVAYALRALEADRVGGLDAQDVMPRAGGSFTGPVGVAGANGNGNVLLSSLGSNPNHGYIAALDAAGEAGAQMFVSASGQGVVSTFSATGALSSTLGGGESGGVVSVIGTQGVTAAFLAASEGGGLIATNNAAGRARTVMTTVNDIGSVLTVGPAGHVLALIDASVDDENHGQISVHDANGDSRAELFVDADGGGRLDLQNAAGGNAVELRAFTGDEGVIVTRGPNGRQNVVISSVTDHPNNGALAVLDANGTVQAGMVVNASGRGEIFADVKNFVVDHPNRPGVQIIYASLEGPEVAIYHRGVARLVDGSATITLPEHFAVLASPGSVTVQLTPASLDSLGVGVRTIGTEQIDIGELRGGHGSYDVHFIVHALRRGYEARSPLIPMEGVAARDDLGMRAADGGPGSGSSLAPARAAAADRAQRAIAAADALSVDASR